MNVFRLIKENGLQLHGDIEHFAHLVAEAAAAEEREACAKGCDELVLAHPGRADLTADQCATAIRARGDE